MQNCNSITQLDAGILADIRWNRDEVKPLLMHSVHVYPAKFPPLIAEEAFRYAEEQNVHFNTVADIFCGCGTVAIEAKRRGTAFWGCDINPVAVLIAKAKTNTYNEDSLLYYIDLINIAYNKLIKSDLFSVCYETAPERLRYWFNNKSYSHLYCLKAAIEESVKSEEYLTAFLCIFSSILKSTSKWLQKSIKPQVDPRKKEIDVKHAFDMQVRRFIKSVREINAIGRNQGLVNIQLTSIWLQYTDDYRKLRNGSIGSTYNSAGIDLDSISLNTTGTNIIAELKEKGAQPSRIKAIARYYSDIEKAIEKCSNMIEKDGMAIFIIGDSELKGVKLFNSKHLVECMLKQGFSDIKIGKRKGRFTKRDASNNEIYHEEYVISGRVE